MRKPAKLWWRRNFYGAKKNTKIEIKAETDRKIEETGMEMEEMVVT